MAFRGVLLNGALINIPGVYPTVNAGDAGPGGGSFSPDPIPPDPLNVSWDCPANTSADDLTITVDAPPGCTFAWSANWMQSWYWADGYPTSDNVAKVNRVNFGDFVLGCCVTAPDGRKANLEQYVTYSVPAAVGCGLIGISYDYTYPPEGS